MHGNLKCFFSTYSISRKKNTIIDMDFTTNPSDFWNIKTFSHPTSKDNFQVEHMIQKIKKIKSTKKKKTGENYKNIEPLVNIYDKDEDENEKEDENENEKKGSNKKKATKERKPSPGSPPIVEGYMDSSLNDNSKWYGDDPVNDNGNAGVESVADKLVQYVNIVYDFFDMMLFKIAELIAKLFSMGNVDDVNDIIIVKRNVGWFFSIVLAWFVVFNWFYVSYYKNAAGKGVDINKDFYRGSLKTKEDTDANGPLYTYIIFWFEFAIFFPEKFQEYFVVWFPSIFEKTLNKTTLFIILFFLFISIIYNYPSRCRTFLVDALKQNGQNMTIMFMLLIVVYLFFAGLITIDFYGMIKTYKNILSIVANPTMIFIILICHIVRFLFAMLCSVPLGGLLVMVYIALYSLLAIPIYSKNINPLPIRKAIWEYIKPSRNFVKKETPCRKFTFWENIVFTINAICDFGYKYCLWIAFIYMFFISLFDYISIKTYLLRMSLLVINAVLIITLCGLSYVQYKEGIKEEQEALLHPKTSLPAENLMADAFPDKPTTPFSATLKSAGIPYLSDAIPSPTLPSLPKAPSMPSLPSLPSAPSLPSTPAMPTVPAMPSAPALPSAPSLPTAPATLPQKIGV